MTQKLEELAKDFPEMKHVLDLSNLFETIDPAVRKYKQEVEAELPFANAESPSGMGVVSRRLALLGKRFNLPLTLQVKEKVDSEGRVTGTEVILLLPLDL